MNLFRPVMIIALLVVSPTAPRQQDAVPNDPYNVETVKLLVDANRGKPGVIFGFQEKSNGRMGDAVSIALLKAYSEQELLRPEMVRAFLPVIRAAFASPGYVVHKSDLEPRVTLFLLHYVERNLKDSEVREQVRKLDSDLSKLMPPPVQSKP